MAITASLIAPPLDGGRWQLDGGRWRHPLFPLIDYLVPGMLGWQADSANEIYQIFSDLIAVAGLM
ncbi:hypothetical protein GCM10027217_00130 [Pseudomaricurvus hydrocarbonicus]